MYDAIVLAGGKSKGAGIGNGEYEALLNIGGRPMLYFVVDALKKSEKIDNTLNIPDVIYMKAKERRKP